MKTLYYFIVLLFIITGTISLHGFSQTTKYDFHYDLSGNRTERIIDLSKSATISATGSSTTNVQSISENLAGQTISIYPNPTKGKLKVSISQLNGSEATLHVYNMKGSTVINKRVSGNTNEIDLSKQPAGMYVLKVTIGENSTDWKIIKD